MVTVEVKSFLLVGDPCHTHVMQRKQLELVCVAGSVLNWVLKLKRFKVWPTEVSRRTAITHFWFKHHKHFHLGGIEKSWHSMYCFEIMLSIKYQYYKHSCEKNVWWMTITMLYNKILMEICLILQVKFSIKIV